MDESKNVYGMKLKTCSKKPMTGFFRDGCCNTDESDVGSHTVCVIVTDDFLKFSKAQGNDLSTPYPDAEFPGLKAGDHWCLCAARWLQAEQAGAAPMVDLEATHERCLEIIDIRLLEHYSANIVN